MFTIYYHPACYTSYRLLRALKDSNAIKSVKLIDMSLNNYLAISRQILTVPLIENNGEQIYGGPIDIEKAKTLVLNGEVSINVEKVREALVSAIADSSAISSLLYYYGDARPLKEFNGFLKSATGLALDKNGVEKMKEVYKIIEEEQLFDEIEHKIIATLAYNKARESIYLGMHDQSQESFIMWFVSKASLGRAGVPFKNIEQIKGKAIKIYEYYSERKEKINEKLLGEIQEIKSGIKDIIN